jgi:MFS family permease
MLIITIFFYKEPPRQSDGVTMGHKLKEIVLTLSDKRFATFLVLLGIFFWLPFWAFFNLCALYVEKATDTAQLYLSIKSVFGTSFANFFSAPDDQGVRHILGETISHTGYIIMIFQLLVSRIVERSRAIPAFLWGLAIAAAGFVVLGLAATYSSSLVFLGIFLFAVGEMITSPRIQEYITWIAPKEKAGLYMGSNFLATAIGAFTSGAIYTTLVFGHFDKAGHPEYVWYVLAGHVLVGIVAIWLFTKLAGEFHEQQE